jgi:choice-of-anchor A domain-containing protein
LNSRLFLVSTALVVLVPQIAPAGIDLGAFNLVTTGNLSDNSDVQGRVLVGGTLNTSNFNFGGHLSGSNLTPPGGIFNALGSGVTSLSNNGHNFIFGSGHTIGGVTASPSAVTPYTTGLASYLSSVSAGYAALATNSTINSNDPNQIKFAASPSLINGQSVAVFSVDQSFFTGNGTVSSLTGVGATTTVVVNVTGAAAALNYGNLNFSSFQNLNDQANIIFNFENATALNNITNLGGSILAPNATLSTGSSLVGSVYLKSISNTGEIDAPKVNGTEVTGFAGFVPSVAVPEPASIVSSLIGLVLAGGVAWRQRQRAV